MPSGPFDVDRPLVDSDPFIVFTVDRDSIDEVRMREPATEVDEMRERVLSAISPLRGIRIEEMKTNRTGDLEVTLDISDATLGDTPKLERRLDEADFEIYGFRYDAS